MPNPAIVACSTGAWTKVATNVQSGFVWLLKTSSFYYHTYRLTGQDAPDPVTDKAEQVRIPKPGLSISASAGIDVYVFCKVIAGSVRVDV